MGRTYVELGCGCLISCDGGGGLILSGGDCCMKGNKCEVDEYMKEHEMVDGQCIKCDGPPQKKHFWE